MPGRLLPLYMLIYAIAVHLSSDSVPCCKTPSSNAGLLARCLHVMLQRAGKEGCREGGGGRCCDECSWHLAACIRNTQHLHCLAVAWGRRVCVIQSV